MKSFSLFFLISTLSLTTLAYQPEEGNVTGTFGPFISRTNYGGSSTGAEARSFGGYGIMALGDINDRSSLEIAIFHMNKQFFVEQDNKAYSERVQELHVTMGYRRWFNNTFSGSLAIFSSYSMGEPQIDHSDFPKGYDISTSAQDITEYGADIALQADIFTYEGLTLLTDVRYSWSATNKPNEKSDHYGTFIGLRYMIQSKSRKID